MTLPRNGLAESLESYTRRTGATLPRHKELARQDWLAEGLRLLGADGKAVRIEGLAPEDVIEIERPHTPDDGAFSGGIPFCLTCRALCSRFSECPGPAPATVLL